MRLGVSLSLNHGPQVARNAACLHASTATCWGWLSQGDTPIPKNMNEQLQKLGLAPLFAAPPKPY